MSLARVQRMKRESYNLPGVSRALLSFLSLVFILAGVPALSLLPAELILFRAASYERALRNQQFAENFPRLLAESFTGEEQRLALPGVDPRASAYLSSDRYTDIFAQLFPAAWVEGQSSAVLQGAMNTLNFQDDTLNLPLDFTEVKARLSGAESEEIALTIIQSWPQCSGEDAARIAAELLSGTLQGFPICRPPDAVLPLVIEGLQAGLRGTAAILPDQMDLAEPLQSGDTVIGRNYWRFYQVYTILRWLHRITPVISLAVLAWIILLSIRSLPDLLTWSGQPVMMAGLIAAGLGILMALFGNSLLGSAVTAGIPVIPDPFKQVVRDTIVEVGNRLAVWQIFAGLAASAVGVILLISARFFEDE